MKEATPQKAFVPFLIQAPFRKPKKWNGYQK